MRCHFAKENLVSFLTTIYFEFLRQLMPYELMFHFNNPLGAPYLCCFMKFVK